MSDATAEKVSNMLQAVNLPDNTQFGIRNFMTTTTYFNGSFVQRLNQLLSKCWQELADNQHNHVKNHTYRLGIPKRKNIGKKVSKNKESELSTYNTSYDRDDCEVDGRGALEEGMIRHNWEIA